jgi:hypothetical protein
MSGNCDQGATGKLASILDDACAGGRIGVAEITKLLNARGREAWEICTAADTLREDLVGDTVTYVVNRNINFTNICRGSCLFCNFRADEGYTLSLEDIVKKAMTPDITEGRAARYTYSRLFARGSPDTCFENGRDNRRYAPRAAGSRPRLHAGHRG